MREVFDNLFWAMAALGAIGGFIDFLLGPSGTKRLLDRLETWWLTFNEVEWRTFGRKETEYVVSLIDRYAGPLFSWKRAKFVAAILIGAYGFVLVWQVARSIAGVCSVSTQGWQSALADPAISLVVTALAISVARASSAFVGRYCRTSISTVIAFTLLLAVHVLMFLYWTPFILLLRVLGESLYQAMTSPGDSLESFAGWLDISRTLEDILNFRPFALKILANLYTFVVFGIPIPHYSECGTDWLSMIAATLVALVTSTARIGFALLFALSFLGRPVIQRPVSLIVARMVEYKLSIGKMLGGVAAGAKIGQEFIKRVF